jgi:mannose-1-phosphate guanylyltransferase
MKAFLLAGGLGTRLRPLTDRTPKCLLPIRGVPILQIWLTLCREFGIEEVLINLHSHVDSVRRFIDDEYKHGLTNETFFWVFYADVLTTTNLTQLQDFHNKHTQIATIGVYEVPDPSRCGIVQVDRRGIVRDFVEKPKVPLGNLAFSGLMVATPAVFDLIPDTIPSDLGFDVLPKLVGRMAACRIADFLIDVGTIETYEAAQESWPGLRQSQGSR